MNRSSLSWKYSKEQFAQDESRKTEELLDFANMVFSVEYSSTDFAFLLPKAYSKERCQIPTHHIIREEKSIRALIDSYPLTMRIKDKEEYAMKACYVGTVCVHPNSRGKGYMIELMKRIEEDAVRQGYALMILDGDRHRYQNYGFEHAGIRYRFHIESNNIRHCCALIYKEPATTVQAYRFEEIRLEGSRLAYLYKLYQRRLVTARSEEDFWLSLQSYGSVAYAVLEKERVIGYVVLSANQRSVSEFELEETQVLAGVIQNLMLEFGIDQLDISVGMDETDKIEWLEKMCDYCDASMSHMIKIIDYEKVFTFLLRWKKQYSTLTAGTYVIGVCNEQTKAVEQYQLSVTEDTIHVIRTEQKADIVLTSLELIRLLTTSFCFVEQLKGEQNKLKNAPTGWFPLPFYLPEADTF
ncbi:MAG: GNAT family N-acetyltransferase [Lachnospiraceae bacterium]|jgi:Predicted acetyltransferase